MTITTLKSADELRQYILVYLKRNEASIAKKNIGYFRLSTEPAPSFTPENSFIVITLHTDPTEIGRNVNDEADETEKHESTHISNDELDRFKANYATAKIRREFMSRPNLTTYKISDFVSLANK